MTKTVAPKDAPKLPDKLSDCLAVALGDLIKCERQKRTYKINMWKFHVPNGKCTVCLAGSVMAQTLGVDPRRELLPEQFSDHNRRRLEAISSVALGHRLGSALLLIERKKRRLEFDNFCMTANQRYAADPTAFKSTIRRYIKELRKHGL